MAFGSSCSCSVPSMLAMQKMFRAGGFLLLAAAASLLSAQNPSEYQALEPLETANRISQFNEALTTAALQSTNSALILDLARQRASLFSRLIAIDPARALALALPQEIAERLRAAAPAGALETRGEWQGRI